MPLTALSLLMISATSVPDEPVLTTRALARGEILVAEDLQGSVEDVAPFVGKAARRPLAEGRKIRPLDIEEPVAVMRQDTVRVTFQRGGLTLETHGRALKNGRVGEVVSIALDGRRAPVAGLVVASGQVEVAP